MWARLGKAPAAEVHPVLSPCGRPVGRRSRLRASPAARPATSRAVFQVPLPQSGLRRPVDGRAGRCRGAISGRMSSASTSCRLLLVSKAPRAAEAKSRSHASAAVELTGGVDAVSLPGGRAHAFSSRGSARRLEAVRAAWRTSVATGLSKLPGRNAVADNSRNPMPSSEDGSPVPAR